VSFVDGGSYAKLLGLSEFLTMDKAGPLATAMTGQIGIADGAPVIVSAEMPLPSRLARWLSAPRRPERRLPAVLRQLPDHRHRPPGLRQLRCRSRQRPVQCDGLANEER
jgi:hypothetical protein